MALAGIPRVHGLSPDWRVPVLAHTTAISAFCLLAFACSGTQKPQSTTRSFGIDDFSDTIRIQARPTRIVSLTPHTTEILFALGAGNRLVGRDMYSHWPDSAERVPNLGQGLRPNIEAVIAAKPDLVLLYASQESALQLLAAANVALAGALLILRLA